MKSLLFYNKIAVFCSAYLDKNRGSVNAKPRFSSKKVSFPPENSHFSPENPSFSGQKCIK